jgi:hypothetical protein
VRSQGVGKDRSQRRKLLVAELASRGLSQSPSSVESSLDHIERAEEKAAASRSRREAEQVVRSQSTGKDRAQLRELFVAELTRRGLHEPPSSIEFSLDRIQDSSLLAQARATVSTLGALGGMARFLHRVFRAPEESLNVPDWLKPPVRANHRVGPFLDADRVAVVLDPNAGPWLDLVLKTLPTSAGLFATLDTWLAWDPEPQSPESRLAVHIGKERVGVIDIESVALYQSVMGKTGMIYDLPVLTATVIRRRQPPRYILELPVPPTSPVWVSSED